MSATHSFASTDMPLALGSAFASSSSGGAHANLFARRLAKNMQAPSHGPREAEQQALLAQLSESQGTPSFEAQRAVAMAFISRRAAQGASLCASSEQQEQSAHCSLDSCPPEHCSPRSHALRSGSMPSAEAEASSLTDGGYDRMSSAFADAPSSAARPDFPLLALSMQDYQHASPGPAANLSSSSADFASELNKWATTPGGATVYPWSAAASTPPSTSSGHHFPRSAHFAFANHGDPNSTVLDPRFGNLDADNALRMLPQAPDFASMTRGDSSATTSSGSEQHSGSGLSSTGAGSSSSFASSVSPFGPLNEATHPAASLVLKQESSGPLHTAQDNRRRSGPREQPRQTYDHLTSVPSETSDRDPSTAAISSGPMAPARTHSRRTSAVDSHGRYVCRHPGCDKTFSTSGHARRHSHVHSPLCPFICPHEGCDATFSRRDNCTQHQRARHPQVLEAHRLDDQDST